MVHLVRKISVFALFLAFPLLLPAQQTGLAPGSEPTQKVVVITGARFAYELVENWIEAYSRVNPGVQIIIESRGSADPLKYDILAEVYEHPAEIREKRQYLYVARYAILPVAHAGSDFASQYASKGFTQDTFREVFFNDIFAQSGKQKPIAEPYTVYTRLQKAGVPWVFARHFGYEQKDIKGTGIAGADAHLLRTLLRDSTAVSYLPSPLIYDEQTGKPIDGLVVLPPDLDGNKKVTDDEKFYDNASVVAARLEKLKPNERKNVPLEYLHLSVDKQTASEEAIKFLKWVRENGLDDLHRFGYLLPEKDQLEDNSFAAFSSRRDGGQ